MADTDFRQSHARTVVLHPPGQSAQKGPLDPSRCDGQSSKHLLRPGYRLGTESAAARQPDSTGSMASEAKTTDGEQSIAVSSAR